MPTTTNMGLVIPTEGGDNDTWDTILNAALTVVDAHDHTAGKGLRVPSAGLKWNADLAASDAGVYYALKDVKALDFQPSAVAGMTSYAGALFCNSADNELYWRTTAGTNVKLTSGTSINATLIGGIGDDYTTAGALVGYINASDLYQFRQEVAAAVRQYAHVAVGDLDLYEYLAAGATPVPVNRIRLSSPGALAASYAVTFPAGLPGSTQLVQMNNGGVLSATNTVPNAVTLTAGATVGAGANITLATTGRYKHGAMETVISAAEWRADSGTAPSSIAGNGVTAGGASTFRLGVRLPVGARILTATLNESRNAIGTVDFSLQSNLALTAPTTVATATDSTGGAGASTIVLSPSYTLVASTAVFFTCVCSNSGQIVGSIIVSYDFP